MNQPSWIGMTLAGRYKVESLLGQGGMSAVYKGTDPNLRRAVAIKLIHPHLSSDPEFVRRFEQEAAAVAQLRHPNIIQVFDFAHDGETYYMILEFLPGETLQARLKALSQTGDRLPLADAVRIIATVCDAVAYAHQHSMVHRDLKPANVMLDPKGQPILMDFGVARMLGGQQHTATGAIVGTVAYMSPEQVRGERVDERSDIYSLGVMMYEMMAGRPPFEGDSAMTVMFKHMNDPVPDIHQFIGDVPDALIRTLDQALAKDVADRFQTAAEMAAALRAVDVRALPAAGVTGPAALEEPEPAARTLAAPPPAAPTVARPSAAKPGEPPPPVTEVPAKEVAEKAAEPEPAVAETAAPTVPVEKAKPAPEPAMAETAAPTVPVEKAKPAPEPVEAAVTKKAPPPPAETVKPPPAPSAAAAPSEKRGLPMGLLIGLGVVGVAIVAGIILLPGLLSGGGAPTAVAQATATTGAVAVVPSPTSAPAQASPTAEALPPPTVAPSPAPPTAEPMPTEVPIPEGMVLVPGGTFSMGSDDRLDEKPIHSVTMAGFFMDQFEVTNARYKACVDAGGCTPPGSNRFANADFATMPVNFVSWEQANAFCQWDGKRLPTEAEWEYAARGTDGRRFPWGNDFDRSLIPATAQNVVAVGSHPGNASPFGVFDLSGNVVEWVADWYKNDYYGEAPAENPAGPDSGTQKVMRGGSFGTADSQFFTATRRYSKTPNGSDIDIGFRCVTSAP